MSPPRFRVLRALPTRSAAAARRRSTLVVAILCLGAAITISQPASAAHPVPNTLCIIVGETGESAAFKLTSLGNIKGIEYFDVHGSWFEPGAFDVLVSGTAHRRGGRRLHLGVIGMMDFDGPGNGGTMFHSGLDLLVVLHTSRGRYSAYHQRPGAAINGTGEIEVVTCSSLSNPSIREGASRLSTVGEH